LEKKQDAEFNLNRIQRFKYRTLYFSDPGIIGSKRLSRKTISDSKGISTKHEKAPKPIKGLDGIYSLKPFLESG